MSIAEISASRPTGTYSPARASSPLGKTHPTNRATFLPDSMKSPAPNCTPSWNATSKNAKAATSGTVAACTNAPVHLSTQPDTSMESRQKSARTSAWSPKSAMNISPTSLKHKIIQNYEHRSPNWLYATHATKSYRQKN